MKETNVIQARRDFTALRAVRHESSPSTDVPYEHVNLDELYPYGVPAHRR